MMQTTVQPRSLKLEFCTVRTFRKRERRRLPTGISDPTSVYIHYSNFKNV